MGREGHHSPDFWEHRGTGGHQLTSIYNIIINIIIIYVTATVNNKYAINFAAADFAGNCLVIT